jgi:hypothetical protein
MEHFLRLLLPSTYPPFQLPQPLIDQLANLILIHHFYHVNKLKVL